ncbi:MAG: 50S ribosomal protein L32 [Mycoplasmataceae bacterium]|jgi:large subunit ribosomal protein L32|nr:50S ribosomal protein L32 [Mycoplasmataceae bacterium]
MSLVGQRRTTKSRKGMRRSHLALDVPNVSTCPKCGKTVNSHRVCKSCGYYKNIKRLEIKK